MLAHLDKNKWCLFDVDEDELFRMITEVATHSFYAENGATRAPLARSADEEVAEIASWIDEHMDFIERGEREITYRELARLISYRGYSLENQKREKIDVVRQAADQRIGRIPYFGEKAVVGVRVIKLVRKMCRLREEDGVDSFSFYDEGAIVDAFINRYRTVLRRLARA